MESKAAKDIFKSKKEEQLSFLKKQIQEVFLINEEQFKVFPIEASLGKTQTMIQTIREMQRCDNGIKFLIVSKFIEEGNDIQKQIRNALAYNSDSKFDVMKKMIILQMRF